MLGTNRLRRVGGFTAIALVVATASSVLVKHIRHAAPETADAHAELPYVLPSPDPDNLAFAEKVQSAVNSASTWHIEGTTTARTNSSQFGLKHFEVWGCANPIFYREQIGDDTVLYDGTTLTHSFKMLHAPQDSGQPVQEPTDPGACVTKRYSATFFPAVARDFVSEFTSIMIPEMPVHSSAVKIPPYPFFYGRRDDSRPEWHQRYFFVEKSAGADGQDGFVISNTILKKSDTGSFTRLRIDPQTLLPVRYYNGYQYGYPLPDGQSRHEAPFACDFKIQYNVAIPRSVQTLKTPSNYQFVDLREAAAVGSYANDTASRSKIALHLVDIAQDTQGNIRLRLDVTREGHPYTGYVLSTLTRIARDSLAFGLDEKNRAYTIVGQPVVEPSGHVSIWLTPTVPYTFAEKRPVRLTLHFPIAPIMIETSEYSRVGSGRFGLPVQWLKLTTAFNTKPAAVPLPPDAVNFVNGLPWTTLAEIQATSRADFYNNARITEPAPAPIPSSESDDPLDSWHNPRPVVHISPANAALAAHWWDVAASEAERNGHKGKTNTYRGNAATARRRVRVRY